MTDLQTLLASEDSEELLRYGTEFFREGEEEKAFACYRAACKLGNAVAMGNLGFCYQAGRGVKADMRLALYCFERACEQEEPGSMLKMGDFYYSGKAGLSKDLARAYGYYCRAYEILSCADGTNFSLIAKLCYRIAVCKKNGKGTEQNPTEAYEYFQAAAEAAYEAVALGDSSAEALLKKAEDGLQDCEQWI